MAVAGFRTNLSKDEFNSKEVNESLKNIDEILKLCIDKNNKNIKCDSCDCSIDCNIKRVIEIVNREFIKKDKRIMYSQVTTNVYTMCNEDFDTLCFTLENIINFIDRTDPKNIKLKNFFFKLLDHINLASKQSDNINEGKNFANRIAFSVSERIRGELEEYKKITDELKKDKDTVYNNLISIIGIFVAISFVMFGGMTLLNNLFDYSRMDNIPIIEMLCLGSLVGLIIVDAIYAFILMIFYLTNKHEQIKEQKFMKKLIHRLNLVLIIFIIITSVLWWFDVKNTYGYEENISGCRVIEVSKETNEYTLKCKGKVNQPTPTE